MKAGIRVALAFCLAVAAVILGNCRRAPQYPTSARVESRVLVQYKDTVTVHNGGYGSAVAPVPGRAGFFYLLADRGPNADTANPDEKAFLVPAFVPHIGTFRLEGGVLTRVAVIEMKDSSGSKLTGLPNATHHADSVENAVDGDGKLLRPDPNGIDPEGLVALDDGTFWVSDEYGPYLLHLDSTGKVIERISPFGANGRGHALPSVLARRRLNYGMEGLTVTADTTTLVGIMQSALDNPDRTVRTATRTTRLVSVDLRTGITQQFVYLRERSDHSASEITIISTGVFLVLERDDNFSTDRTEPARHKRVYRIDIGRATDISDPANGLAGKLFNGKTLEQLSESEMASAQINPVTKTLVADLLALPGGYAHDKPEGLALVAGQILAVSNDDDFGVSSDAGGVLTQKTVPGTNVIDQNELYFVRLESGALPSAAR